MFPLKIKTPLACGFGSPIQKTFGLMVDILLQLWNNLRYAYGDQPDLVELVETLSENFERLYENEVRTILFSLPFCFSLQFWRVHVFAVVYWLL